ncbi:MAG: FIST signal transduction protein [Candidatus Nanohalobium sp.]
MTEGVKPVSVKASNPEKTAGKMLERLPEDFDPGFAFVFASPKLDLERFTDALNSRSNFAFAGCTTGGEITPEGPASGTVAALFIDREDVDFQVEAVENVSEEPESKGKELGELLEDRPEFDNSGVFLLNPGMTMLDDGVQQQVLNGISRVLPSDVPIAGGAAGDGFKMEKTFQFTSEKNVMEDGAIAIKIFSDHTINSVQEHGNNEEIATGIVTEREGREIIRIGDKKAAKFYADATGVKVSDLRGRVKVPLKGLISMGKTYLKHLILGGKPRSVDRIYSKAFEYSIAKEVGPSQRIVLQPISVTGRGGIVLPEEVRETQVIKVLKGDKEDIISSGQVAVGGCTETLFSVFADCVTRRIMLEDDEMKEEISQIRESIGDCFVGWYALGEIGGGEDKVCNAMNQTVSGLTVCRKD